jgi:hypothetical protein
MEVSARPVYGPHDLPISNLAWGAVTFVAFVALLLLARKAIGRLRGKLGKSDVPAVEDERPQQPKDSWDNAISRPPADHNWVEGLGSCDLGGLEGMTQREQEDLFATHAPRKVRKAMKQRQRAREQRQGEGAN